MPPRRRTTIPRDELSSASTVLEPLPSRQETTEEQAARIIFHTGGRFSRAERQRQSVRHPDASTPQRELPEVTLPPEEYFSPNSAPDIAFNVLSANDEPEMQSNEKRNFRFNDVYATLKSGVLDVALHEFTGKEVYALCQRAVSLKEYTVLETLARAVLFTVPIHIHKIPPLLLRVHIVHLSATTVFQLYEAFSPKLRIQYMSTLFMHDELYKNATILAKVAEMFSPTTEEPSDRIWPPFEVLFRLTHSGMHNEALALLRKMAASGHVPPEALRSDPNLRDFSLLIYQTAARSLLHWELPRQAGLFLVRILEHLGENPLDRTTAELLPLVIDSMVTLGGRKETTLAIDLFRKMAALPGAPRIPDSILYKLYDATRTHRLYNDAMNLYGKTQAGKVRQQYLYPPPRGHALPWLLHHISRAVKDEYLSRLLVNHVLQSSVPIIPAARASIIALAADHGFGQTARRLWERFAGGRFGPLVAANNQVLVRLISLFASLVKRERQHIEELLAQQRLRLPRTVSLDRDMMDDGPNHGDSEPAAFPTLDGPADAEGISGGVPEQTPMRELPKDETADEDSHDALQLDLEQRRRRHDDFVMFARRVLATFRHAKAPLVQASREDLNALARAYFLLGDVHGGFDVLMLVMKRSQVPDTHDINVALSAVASEDPTTALRMVEMMVKRRRLPDSVTVGTLIHQALRRGLLDVTERMLEIANEHDIPLDLKTVEGVVRASLDASRGDRAATLDNLRRALLVLQENKELPYLSRAALGEVCARAAVGIGEGALAYEFWHDLVRRATDWRDPEQGKLRMSIAHAVEAARGRIGDYQTELMLKGLADPMQKRKRLPASQADLVRGGGGGSSGGGVDDDGDGGDDDDGGQR